MATKQPPKTPQTKDLVIYQATSLVVEVEVSGIGDISGATIAMKVKKKEADADVDSVISKRTGGLGITITVPGSATTPGKFEVKFDPIDTANLDPLSYLYDIKMMIGSDVFVVVERSHFDIEPTVTRTV